MTAERGYRGNDTKSQMAAEGLGTGQIIFFCTPGGSFLHEDLCGAGRAVPLFLKLVGQSIVVHGKYRLSLFLGFNLPSIFGL